MFILRVWVEFLGYKSDIYTVDFIRMWCFERFFDFWRGEFRCFLGRGVG